MSSLLPNDDHVIKVPLAVLLIAIVIVTALFVGAFSYGAHMHSEVIRLKQSELFYLQALEQTWKSNDFLLNRADSDGNTARLRIRDSLEAVPSDNW